MPSMDDHVVDRRRFVRAQAQAQAAAATAAVPRIVTVAWVEVEDTPAHVVSTPEDEELELDPEWVALPQPWGAALDRLLAVDTVSCLDCGAPIAYVLASRRDTYDREHEAVEWRPVVLVRGIDPDSAVGAVCWDCGPRLPEPLQ